MRRKYRLFFYVKKDVKNDFVREYLHIKLGNCVVCTVLYCSLRRFVFLSHESFFFKITAVRNGTAHVPYYYLSFYFRYAPVRNCTVPYRTVQTKYLHPNHLTLESWESRESMIYSFNHKFVNCLLQTVYSRTTCENKCKKAKRWNQTSEPRWLVQVLAYISRIYD